MCQNFVCRTRSKNPNLWVIHQTGKVAMETWKFGGALGLIYATAWRRTLKINRFVTSSD